jgi:Cu/Ag efflux protein CusF
MPSSQADSAKRDTATQTSPTQSPQMPANARGELSGVVKKVDASKHSVRISSSTGAEQELKLAPDAKIMRDGTQVSLDQLKEGDQVRASFDPSSNQTTSIQLESKTSSDQSKTTDQKTTDQSKTDQTKTKTDTTGTKEK